MIPLMTNFRNPCFRDPCKGVTENAERGGGFHNAETMRNNADYRGRTRVDRGGIREVLSHRLVTSVPKRTFPWPKFER